MEIDMDCARNRMPMGGDGVASSFVLVRPFWVQQESHGIRLHRRCQQLAGRVRYSACRHRRALGPSDLT